MSNAPTLRGSGARDEPEIRLISIFSTPQTYECTIVAQAIVGAVTSALSIPISIESHSKERSHVILRNLPEGDHEIQIKIVDLNRRMENKVVDGRLNVVEIRPSDNTVPQEFVLGEDFLRQFASKEVFRPPRFEAGTTRQPGDVWEGYETEIMGTMTPFSLDFAASTATHAVLATDLRLKWTVSKVRYMMTNVKSGKYIPTHSQARSMSST